MSSSKDKTTKYKNEIKSNFKAYNDNKKDTINTKKLNDFISISNSTQKNKFMYDSIKSLIESKQEMSDENITSDEYISHIENKLNSDKTKKNIFDVFCDSKTQKISWNKFPLIAKELGNEELSENLMNLLRQSKLYSKELNYEEFLNIISPESEEENWEIEENEENEEINNGKIEQNKEKENSEENLKINDYIENYEDIPTYKQKKMIENRNKKYDEEISSSSKSVNKISDDVIIEEQSEENKISNNEVDNDNEKINKRYHRRYRSKKIQNNNNENNNNNEGTNINHKSFNKYRKKHS